jgi:hypothetical protein
MSETFQPASLNWRYSSPCSYNEHLGSIWEVTNSIAKKLERLYSIRLV